MASFLPTRRQYFMPAPSRTWKALISSPESVIWIIFSALEEHQEVTDEGFVQSFLTSDSMTRAQLVLRTAASFPLKEDQRVHWKAIGTNLDAILSCDTLLTDAQAQFGTFIQYIFHQQPQTRPGFLPEGWRANDTQPGQKD